MSLRRGSLRPDRGNAGGAEGQIHGSPQQHRNISARSGRRFVLTNANVRTGKRGEGGGEADNKMLGAYGRDLLNENGKLLLDFAEDTMLALSSEHFILHPQKWRVPHVPKRQPQQGKRTFVLYPDKAGGPPTHPLR